MIFPKGYLICLRFTQPSPELIPGGLPVFELLEGETERETDQCRNTIRHAACRKCQRNSFLRGVIRECGAKRSKWNAN